MAITFPNAAKTDAEKIAYLFRLKEKLRLWHNEHGRDLPLEEFRAWERKEFRPRNRAITAALSLLVEDRALPEFDSPDFPAAAAVLTEKDRLRREDSKWDPDINLEGIEGEGVSSPPTDPIEDFETFTKVNPTLGTITVVSATEITYASWETTDGYIYKDYGAGYFPKVGEFEHKFDVIAVEDGTDNPCLFIWSIDDSLGAATYTGEFGTIAGVSVIPKADYLYVLQDNSNVVDTACPLNARRWLTVERVKHATNDWNMLTCYVYDDSDRTSLVNSPAHGWSVAAASDNRYLYALRSTGVTTNRGANGDVQNLDIGAEGDTGDRWWVNDDADNDWENANNWAWTEGGAGGKGVPTGAENVYFSATSSNDNCTLSANSAGAALAVISAVTGGSDNYTGTIAVNTFNLPVTNTLTLTGCTFTVGVSAGTGVTCTDFTQTSGALDNYGKITVAGNLDRTGVAWVNRGGSSLTLTGADKALATSAAAVFQAITVTGTYVKSDGNSFRLKTTLTVDGDLDLQNGVTVGGAPNVDVTLAGSGEIKSTDTNGYILCVQGNFSVSGTITISCGVEIQQASVNRTCDAWAFGSWLKLYSNAANPGTRSFNAGAISVGGNLTVEYSKTDRPAAWDFSANNNAVTVSGNISVTKGDAGTLSLGSGTWTVAGSPDFTSLGTLNHNNGALVLNGSSAGQIVTSAGKTLYDVTCANTHANGVTFADNLSCHDLLSSTNDAVIKMTDDITAAISGDSTLTGTSGHNIILTSTGGTPATYKFNVGGAGTFGYTSVQGCDASGGSEIDATNNCVDNDDNTNVDFTGLSVPVLFHHYAQMRRN